jgi:hypothetical protein
MVRLAATKPSIFRQIAWRTIFGARVPDPPASARPAPALHGSTAP